MYEQLSIADVPIPSRWKPEVDTGCRMWACPDCGGRNGKRERSHKRLEDAGDE